MPTFKVKARSISPYLQHRYIGDRAKRVNELPDKEQANEYLYRMDGPDSNICIPGAHFAGSLITSFIFNAGSKMKKKTELEVTPCIQVVQESIDLKTNKFETDKRIIPIKKNGSIAAMNEVVRPSIKKWECEFELLSTLERTDEEIRAEFEKAGKYQGIGSGRKIGYGRYEIVSFERV